METDIFDFALSWKNEEGVVICNCLGQDLGPEGAAMHTVKITKVTSCRVVSNREPTLVNAESTVFSTAVQKQMDSIIGMSFKIAEPVLKRGLLQYIEPPTT